MAIVNNDGTLTLGAYATTNRNFKIKALDDTGGLLIQNDSSSYTTRVTITSAGNVTVGGTLTSTGVASFTSPVLTTPVLGTPTSGNLANCTGIPASTAISSGTSNVTVNSSGGTVTVATAGTTAITVDTGQRTTFPTTIGVGAATPSTSGSGITFPATQSASSNANTLDDYDEYSSGSVACTGAITTSITWSITKVGRLVTLSWPNCFQTSPIAAAVITAGFTIPAKYRPVTSDVRSRGVSVANNSVQTQNPGVIIPDTTGAINVYMDGISTSWTAAGTGGFYGGSLSWTV